MQITIDVNKTVVKELGLIQVNAFFEKQLQLFELQMLAYSLAEKLKQSEGVKWELKFVAARKNAWNEYQQLFLKP